jgi:hypothetical protein
MRKNLTPLMDSKYGMDPEQPHNWPQRTTWQSATTETWTKRRNDVAALCQESN